jgi:hypothetical protein
MKVGAPLREGLSDPYPYRQNAPPAARQRVYRPTSFPKIFKE